jgi:hypothetical protein
MAIAPATARIPFTSQIFAFPAKETAMPAPATVYYHIYTCFPQYFHSLFAYFQLFLFLSVFLFFYQIFSINFSLLIFLHKEHRAIQ